MAKVTVLLELCGDFDSDESVVDYVLNRIDLNVLAIDVERAEEVVNAKQS